MDTDFVFIVNYACPRCQAALESRSGGPPSWVRCPACGRACLPPENDRIAAPPYVDDRTMVIGNLTTGGAAFAPLDRSGAVAFLPDRPAPAAPTARLLLGSGFFLSMALFVFSLLESRGGLVGLFGLAAVTCLILLARQPKRPTPE